MSQGNIKHSIFLRIFHFFEWNFDAHMVQPTHYRQKPDFRCIALYFIHSWADQGDHHQFSLCQYFLHYWKLPADLWQHRKSTALDFFEWPAPEPRNCKYWLLLSQRHFCDNLFLFSWMEILAFQHLQSKNCSESLTVTYMLLTIGHSFRHFPTSHWLWTGVPGQYGSWHNFRILDRNRKFFSTKFPVNGTSLYSFILFNLKLVKSSCND